MHSRLAFGMSKNGLIHKRVFVLLDADLQCFHVLKKEQLKININTNLTQSVDFTILSATFISKGNLFFPRNINWYFAKIKQSPFLFQES